MVKETLRRWPPGWLFDRTPIAPITIGGYPFRPGQILYFSPYVIHLDPSNWDSPLEFRPERFAAGVEIPREIYLPFGDGPRMCIGNRFAEAEIAPAALMVGDRDWPPLIELNERIAARIPGCRLIRLPGADHYPQYRAPEAIAAAIDETMSRVAGG